MVLRKCEAKLDWVAQFITDISCGNSSNNLAFYPPPLLIVITTEPLMPLEKLINVAFMKGTLCQRHRFLPKILAEDHYPVISVFRKAPAITAKSCYLFFLALWHSNYL